MTRRTRMYWFLLPLAVFVILTAGLVVASWRRPALGLQAGKLRPCPDSPNCVCSFTSEGEHSIAPMAFTGDADAAWQRLQSLLRGAFRAVVITESGDYLHVEFTTPWLRFVDDVEFQLDRPAGVIQVRSASRVGRSDLGANRRRVEELRAAFESSAD